MRGLEVADEGFGHELGAVVGYDARPEAGIYFVSPLKNDLCIGFLHCGPNVP